MSQAPRPMPASPPAATQMAAWPGAHEVHQRAAALRREAADALWLACRSALARHGAALVQLGRQALGRRMER